MIFIATRTGLRAEGNDKIRCGNCKESKNTLEKIQVLATGTVRSADVAFTVSFHGFRDIQHRDNYWI